MGQELATKNSERRWLAPSLGANLDKALTFCKLWHPKGDDVPLVNPVDRANIPALVDDLRRGLIGTDRIVIEPMLATLAVAFPTQNISDVEAEKRMQLYSDGLSDIPYDILREAFRRAVRECKFFPTVKELRDFAGKDVGKRRATIAMLQLLAKRFDEHIPPEEMIDPADVAKLLADFKSIVAQNVTGGASRAA